MKNLREEIEKVFKDVKIFPEGLGYGKDSNVSHWRIVKFGELEHLVRSWAEHILIELRHIRANAPLTVGDKGKTRGRLDELIKKIEEANET